MSLRRSDDPLDTYLLRVFVLLITERSVSRTALRLNQSQPAVSAALKRLREILGDTEIANVAREGRDDLRRLNAPGGLDRSRDRGHLCVSLRSHCSAAFPAKNYSAGSAPAQ